MRMDRVLLSAILFSAVWHLFWMSAFTVVVVPKDTKPPKFSSVSFLGPILEQSMLSVSSAAHERSTLEKRYLSEIEGLSAMTGRKAGPEVYAQAGQDAGNGIFEFDEILTAPAISAIDGDKVEPGNLQ